MLKTLWHKFKNFFLLEERRKLTLSAMCVFFFFTFIWDAAPVSLNKVSTVLTDRTSQGK